MAEKEVKLVDIRCSCGKLLGRVQEGAAHEHKCPRCKLLTVAIIERESQHDKFMNMVEHPVEGQVITIKRPNRY